MRKCTGGNHQLEIIFACGPDTEETVVRWCYVCGAVVVDIDFDGRTNPGQIMKMRFPELTKNNDNT